jgi:hypothetical protein
MGDGKNQQRILMDADGLRTRLGAFTSSAQREHAMKARVPAEPSRRELAPSHQRRVSAIVADSPAAVETCWTRLRPITFFGERCCTGPPRSIPLAPS